MIPVTFLALAAGVLAQPLSHSHFHVPRAVLGQKQPPPTHQQNATDGYHIFSTGQQAPSACAVGSINNQDGVGSGTDKYVQYTGNGTPAQGWPDKSSE